MYCPKCNSERSDVVDTRPRRHLPAMHGDHRSSQTLRDARSQRVHISPDDRRLDARRRRGPSRRIPIPRTDLKGEL